MNILVIGNGFDLAHGLPTKYGDFLEFCERASRIYTYVQSTGCYEYEEDNLNKWEINSEIKDALKNAFESRKLNRINNEDGTHYDNYSTNNALLDELNRCIKNNVWLKYFLKCHTFIGENWIDFESEISRVVQSLDELIIVISNGGSHLDISKEKQEILISMMKASKGSLRDNYGNVKAVEKYAQFLNKELERLIRALEIYIVEFVGGILINKNSTDINRLNPDHVLSFNYSDTYEKLYGNGKKIEYDYIHGKADINNTIESNNMVLGIDEYLPIDRKDKEISFIAFKKYYQRIYKGTGCEYKDWMYTIKESAKSIELKLREGYPEQIPFIKYTNDARHNLYIFGHSLDVTDKDILRDLILNDNVYTKIFYFNKIDLASKIANLVKVIGQDELIRRTGGSTKTIEFKLQQDMVEQNKLEDAGS